MIVIPSQGRGGGAKGLIFDIDPRRPASLAYKKYAGLSRASARTANRRISPAAWGSPGVAELDKFVNQGGVLITLGAASFLPAEIGHRADRRCRRAPPPQFYAPGPIVEAEILRAEPPDLLRLHEDHRAGPVGRRSAAAAWRPRTARTVLMHVPRRRRSPSSAA